MIGIYKITNPNNKVYIGQSVDITTRWNTHRRSIYNKKKTRLINSFLKYGVNNHIFEIVEVCDVLKLNERERHYQDYYNVIEFGLNSKLTQTNDKSGSLSEETKQKISSGVKKAADEGKSYFKNKRILKEIENERNERNNLNSWEI